MKQKTLILLPLISLTLTSCGTISKYQEHLKDYVFTRSYHTNYNILQLTDIHWNANTSTMASKQYLDKVFKETDAHIKKAYGADAHIDLVELTGDMFMLANSYQVKTFIEYFEEKAKEYHFDYASIWGNHDRHGIYNPNWLAAQFTNAPHSLYYEPNDDLYGRSNFIINLVDADANPVWQIANLDSGASFSETAVSPFRDYDYIRDDQVNWWKLEHAAANNVPTIAYYHIPQDDNLKAWNEIHEQGATYKHKFFKLEGFADNGNEQYASKFIKEGRNNNLRAAFMGHAHNVDWTVDYNGVVLGLGVKTGTELYYAHIDVKDTDKYVQEGLSSVGITENFDLIGASLVTITGTETFNLEHLYLNERASGDFIKWVGWGE